MTIIHVFVHMIIHSQRSTDHLTKTSVLDIGSIPSICQKVNKINQIVYTIAVVLNFLPEHKGKNLLLKTLHHSDTKLKEKNWPGSYLPEDKLSQYLKNNANVSGEESSRQTHTTVRLKKCSNDYHTKISKMVQYWHVHLVSNQELSN